MAAHSGGESPRETDLIDPELHIIQQIYSTVADHQYWLGTLCLLRFQIFLIGLCQISVQSCGRVGTVASACSVVTLMPTSTIECDKRRLKAILACVTVPYEEKLMLYTVAGRGWMTWSHRCRSPRYIMICTCSGTQGLLVIGQVNLVHWTRDV